MVRICQVVFTKLAESSWRTLLFWLGPPGLVVAGLCLLTLDEPRKASSNWAASLLTLIKKPFSYNAAAAEQQSVEQLGAQQYTKVPALASPRLVEPWRAIVVLFTTMSVHRSPAW